MYAAGCCSWWNHPKYHTGFQFHWNVWLLAEWFLFVCFFSLFWKRNHRESCPFIVYPGNSKHIIWSILCIQFILKTAMLFNVYGLVLVLVLVFVFVFVLVIICKVVNSRIDLQNHTFFLATMTYECMIRWHSKVGLSNDAKQRQIKSIINGWDSIV